MMHQDDPSKCTSSKLIKFNLAKPIYSFKQIPKNSIVLNPFANHILLNSDSKFLKFGLIAIDCSWKKSMEVFSRRFKGQNRRLPLLLAANPINYARLSTLSSAEALAASLYITRFEDLAISILSKFKWGLNFIKLNKEPLEEYKRVKREEEVEEIEKSYFKTTSKKLISKIYEYVRD